MSPYFSIAYFSSAYFDTDTAPVSGGHRLRRRSTPITPPFLDDGDELFALF